MKIDPKKLIQAATEEHVSSVDYSLKRLQYQLFALSQWGEAFAQLDATVEFSVYGHLIEFSTTEHNQTLQIIKAFGGRWDKTKEEDYKGNESFRYRQVVEVGERPWTIEINASAPPPSCEVQEVEELVPEYIEPARIRKVRKIVCTSPSPVGEDFTQEETKQQSDKI